jgi:hypothetical protein
MCEPMVRAGEVETEGSIVVRNWVGGGLEEV